MEGNKRRKSFIRSRDFIWKWLSRRDVWDIPCIYSKSNHIINFFHWNKSTFLSSVPVCFVQPFLPSLTYCVELAFMWPVVLIMLKVGIIIILHCNFQWKHYTNNSSVARWQGRVFHICFKPTVTKILSTNLFRRD